MPAPDWTALRRSLLVAGTAPSVVDRTLLELEDHFMDLVEAATAGGAARAEAERGAIEQLGGIAVLAEAVNRRGELKSWAWRWPRVACVVYPVACVIALPAAPIIAGVEHADAVGRWLGGIVVAALVTASIFLALQLSITAG